jgi:hypothetical protein
MDLAIETSLISAGTSLVVLTIGQVLTPIIRDSLTEKKEAKYLAIRDVCILDKFVEDCASTAVDDGQEDNAGRNIAQVTAPEPPAYPSDVNWKSTNPALMYKLLALPAITERAANYVEASSENAFPPDYGEWFQARTESYSSLGLQSHDLAEVLRKEYDMPPAEYLFWDPVDRMKDELKKIKDWQEERTRKFEELRKSGLPFGPPPPPPLEKSSEPG